MTASTAGMGDGVDEPVDLSMFGTLADAEDRTAEWFWPGRMAWDGVVLLAGDGAMGKSTLAQTFAAMVTRGEAMPGGTARAGGALILTTEEDPDVVLKPRLRALGADLEAVQFLDITKGSISFPSGQDQFAALCERDGIRFVLIDPSPAFMDPGLKSNREEDIRRYFGAVWAVIREHRMLAVSNHHINKMQNVPALDRVMGGRAWTNVPRQSLLVAAPVGVDPRESPERLLTVMKDNYATYPPPGAQAFTLTSSASDRRVGSITWGEEVAGLTADDVVSSVTSEERSRLNDAKEFLVDELSAGPRPAKDVEAAAKLAEISQATLRRARQAVCAKPTRLGNQSFWMLRDAPTCSTSPTRNVEHVEHVEQVTGEREAVAS